MNHRINKSNHKAILSLLIPTLTITILSGVYTAPTHADTPASSSSSTNASITVSNTINLTLTGGDLVINNLTPGSTSDSNVITATITSNSPYGYHLSATTGTSSGTTSLINTADSNFVFTNLNANKATLNDFSDNTWGYSYSTDNGATWISGDHGTALAGYNGLTLDNDDSGATGTTLYNNDSYAGSTAVKFKIGAKSTTTQAAGTYTGTVNFYAVTNPKPVFYMQDMDANKLAQLMPSVEDTTILTDKRDEQEYRVAKLKDNKYWMVENLNLAGGTILSSDTTDFPSTYTTPTDKGWKSDGGIPESSMDGFNSNLNDSVYNSGNRESCINGGTYIPCYSYYSWGTATVGSGREISSVSYDAPYSICPKNWRLPTAGTNYNEDWKRGDYYALALAYNVQPGNNSWANSSEFYNNAGPGTVANFQISGRIDFSQHNGNTGYYWSSTSEAGNTNAYQFELSNTSVSFPYGGGRRYGYSVRCLFKGSQ